MKVFISILFGFLLTNCNAQDSGFKSYLSEFGQSKLPLLIFNNQSSYRVFCQRHDTLLGMMPKVISEKFVEKYICTNGFCNYDVCHFRYDYGVSIDYGKEYSTVLVSKLQYEGKTEWDFDLVEDILITYNQKGEVLSRKYLTKDNDRWKSELIMTKDSINVCQIKITDPKFSKTSKLQCTFWTTKYQINNDGFIETINMSPVKNGFVIWDENIQDFRIIII
jgi:hypothetical protein